MHEELRIEDSTNTGAPRVRRMGCGGSTTTKPTVFSSHGPRRQGPAALMYLQRSAGNAAVASAMTTLKASASAAPEQALRMPDGMAGGTANSPGGLVVQRGKAKIARRIVGWAVTVGERKLIKRAAIYTEREMAKLLGKGYSILVRGGAEQAKRVAEKVWGDGFMKHGGHFIKKAGKFGEPHFQPIKQLAKQHARSDLEKGWHIFYGAAPVVFLADDAEAHAIYEDKYPGKSIANYLTVTHYAGEDSWLSYLDWINPGELIALGGDIGRDWDRERTKELRGLVFNLKGRDGSIQTYEMDPEGVLLRVIVVSASGRTKEMEAEDFYTFLAAHAKSSPPTLPAASRSDHANSAGDFDPEYRIYLSKRGWQYDREHLSFFLPKDDASGLRKIGEFWVNFDEQMDYLYVFVHPKHRATLGTPGFAVPKQIVHWVYPHISDKPQFLGQLLDKQLKGVELKNLPLGGIAD